MEQKPVRYKQLKVGLITGFTILVIGLAFGGYNDTLAKKAFLFQNYLDSGQLKETYVQKSDLAIIDERTRIMFEMYKEDRNDNKKMHEKVDVLMNYMRMSYKEEQKSNCPYPPCVSKKKKKGAKIATSEDEF
jgi:hypothetical protein